MEPEARNARDEQESRQQVAWAASGGSAMAVSPMVAAVVTQPPPVRRPALTERQTLRRGLNRLVNPRFVWPRVFRIGLVMWGAAVLVTQLTSDLTLVPAVILIGSFLVPVTCLIVAWEHRFANGVPQVSTTMVLRAATVGGLGGLLAAAALEQLVVHQNLGMYYEVGLIEEAAKLAALLWCARMLTGRTVRGGLVLGASVGFGFAALESAGYAFNAMLTPQGLSLASLVDTEVLRAVLAPFGHGVWTAVAAAAWFAAYPSGWVAVRRSRRRGAVPTSSPDVTLLRAEAPAAPRRRSARLIAVAAFLLVAMLHAAFDGVNGIVLTVLNLPHAIRTGSLSQLWSGLAQGDLPVPGSTLSYHVAYDLGLTVVILLGLSALFVARQAIRRREAATTRSALPTPPGLIADGTRPQKEL
jgi:RsiW-degrading membrane proteinase PrsW (M82 family)